MKTNVEYASFQISDIGSNYYVANKLFELQKEHPEYFIDGIKLESVFGSWPSAIWQGERPYFGYTPFKTIKNKIKTLNKNDAGIYYTFNNRSLVSTDVWKCLSGWGLVHLGRLGHCCSYELSWTTYFRY